MEAQQAVIYGSELEEGQDGEGGAGGADDEGAAHGDWHDDAHAAYAGEALDQDGTQQYDLATADPNGNNADEAAPDAAHADDDGAWAAADEVGAQTVHYDESGEGAEA